METQSRFDDMAYGPIGKEVQAVMPYTEADPIGVFASVLALFSAGVNGHVVQPGGRPTVVWTCLVGRSGLGMKGTALEAGKHILKPAMGDFLDVHLRSGISSGPSLVNAVFEQQEKSGTTEGGTDNRLIIIEEEWQNQLKRTNRCPTFSGHFRTAWDGKMISNTTKGSKPGERYEQRVDEPLLGFHSHIQPGAWGKFISNTEALGGSYNRILPVLVKQSKFLPEPEEGEERPIYTYVPSPALKRAYEWARKEKRVMSLSAPARKRFDELRMEYAEKLADMPEILASFFERSAEQVKRVASILTAANRRTSIPREAVEAARHFVDYSIASVVQLQRELASDSTRPITPLDERIRRCLRKHENHQASRSTVYRAVGAGRYSAAQVEAEARAMPDVEVFEVRDTKRSGAKPTYFRLITEDQEAPEPEASVPGPRPAEAEQLLNLYAEWAGQEGNAGKSLSDFLAAVAQPSPAPAKKAPAKRSAAPRKATKGTASSSATSSTRTRGTAAKKTAAKKTAAAVTSN